MCVFLLGGVDVDGAVNVGGLAKAEGSQQLISLWREREAGI